MYFNPASENLNDEDESVEDLFEFIELSEVEEQSNTKKKNLFQQDPSKWITLFAVISGSTSSQGNLNSISTKKNCCIHCAFRALNK